MLLCGANGTSQGFTTGTAYWVGTFDGNTFTPDSSTPQWLDAGPDFYAATVFADATHPIPWPTHLQLHGKTTGTMQRQCRPAAILGS